MPTATARKRDQFVDELPLAQILPSPDNPRGAIAHDDPDTVELADSIRENGIVEPVIVAAKFTDEQLLSGEVTQMYDLVAGHRRYVAAEVADLTGVPAIIRDLTPAEVDQQRIVENDHRADLSPMSRARGLQRLIDLHGMTQVEAAKVTGRNQGNVSRSLKLLDLIPAAQDAVEVGALGATNGYNLAKLRPDYQGNVIDAVLQHSANFEAALNVESERQRRQDSLDEARSTLDLEGVEYQEVTGTGVAYSFFPEGPTIVTDLPWPTRDDDGTPVPYAERIEEHRQLPCSMAFLHEQHRFFPTGAGHIEWGCNDPQSHVLRAAEPQPSVAPAIEAAITAEAEGKREAIDELFGPSSPAVVVGEDGQLVNSPETQAAVDEARAHVEQITAEREEAERQEAEERAEIERVERALAERAAVNAHRWTFITEKVLQGRSPKGAAEHVLRGVLLEGLVERIDQVEEKTVRFALDLLGARGDDLHESDLYGSLLLLVGEKGDKLTRAALAMRLAADELLISRERRAYHSEPEGPIVLQHFRFLIDQGYELAEHEQRLVDEAQSGQAFVDEHHPESSEVDEAPADDELATIA